jgi:hypothetical protein
LKVFARAYCATTGRFHASGHEPTIEEFQPLRLPGLWQPEAFTASSRPDGSSALLQTGKRKGNQGFLFCKAKVHSLVASLGLAKFTFQFLVMQVREGKGIFLP